MSTIKLFNKAFKGNTTNYQELSKLAYKVGYLIHPECSTTEVESFLNSQVVDIGSTFYKTWEAVTSKTRFELLLDQVAHYASTYGTNYKGEVYFPEGVADLPSFNTFKVIMPISCEEAISRCETMLFSGIALKQETIEQIIEVLKLCKHTPDINLVKNKEAKMWLYQSYETTPTDEVEMLRYLVFCSTNKSLLIKDKQTIEAIKESKIDITKQVETFGLDKLSSIFLRYKPLFLAFKKSNPKLINRLRKLAIKNHKPTTPSYWENILSNPESIGQLPSKIKEINNFKKITLLEAINVKLAHSKINTFPIRNGKIWLDEEKRKTVDEKYLELVKGIIYDSLVESLKSKATTIKLPTGVDLKLPKSEKSFVGNYPLGSSVLIDGKNCIVGINWKGVDGAQDLDLKLIDINGTQFGWNANFTNMFNSIVYSGDMTSADPEATELFYASSGKFKPSILKVNMFNGKENSKFKFFFANEKIDSLTKNYMVNPNSIVTTVEMQMDSQEKSLGILLPDRFIFASFRTGNKQVAGDSITNKYIQYTLDTLDCYIELKPLLQKAGFTITTDGKADIDITELSKDALINLLS
jgi:hypothetical protein